MKNDALKAITAFIEARQAERAKLLNDLQKSLTEIDNSIADAEKEFLENGSKRIADQLSGLKARKKNTSDLLKLMNGSKIFTDDNPVYREHIEALKKECSENYAAALKETEECNKIIAEHLAAIKAECQKIKALRDYRDVYLMEALRDAQKITGQIRKTTYGGGYYMADISEPIFKGENISRIYKGGAVLTIENRDETESCLRLVRDCM